MWKNRWLSLSFVAGICFIGVILFITLGLSKKEKGVEGSQMLPTTPTPTTKVVPTPTRKGKVEKPPTLTPTPNPPATPPVEERESGKMKGEVGNQNSKQKTQKDLILRVTGDYEIDHTIDLIKQGGPFPYPDKDGSLFRNREGLLPKAKRGYYREYTVPTPGVRHRGARRIVTGGTPPSVYYLTVDHYNSFKKLDVSP